MSMCQIYMLKSKLFIISSPPFLQLASEVLFPATPMHGGHHKPHNISRRRLFSAITVVPIPPPPSPGAPSVVGSDPVLPPAHSSPTLSDDVMLDASASLLSSHGESDTVLVGEQESGTVHVAGIESTNSAERTREADLGQILCSKVPRLIEQHRREKWLSSVEPGVMKMKGGLGTATTQGTFIPEHTAQLVCGDVRREPVSTALPSVLVKMDSPFVIEPNAVSVLSPCVLCDSMVDANHSQELFESLECDLSSIRKDGYLPPSENSLDPPSIRKEPDHPGFTVNGPDLLLSGNETDPPLGENGEAPALTWNDQQPLCVMTGHFPASVLEGSLEGNDTTLVLSDHTTQTVNGSTLDTAVEGSGRCAPHDPTKLPVSLATMVSPQLPSTAAPTSPEGLGLPNLPFISTAHTVEPVHDTHKRGDGGVAMEPVAPSVLCTVSSSLQEEGRSFSHAQGVGLKSAVDKHLVPCDQLVGSCDLHLQGGGTRMHDSEQATAVGLVTPTKEISNDHGAAVSRVYKTLTDEQSCTSWDDCSKPSNLIHDRPGVPDGPRNHDMLGDRNMLTSAGTCKPRVDSGSFLDAEAARKASDQTVDNREGLHLSAIQPVVLPPTVHDRESTPPPIDAGGQKLLLSLQRVKYGGQKSTFVYPTLAPKTKRAVSPSVCNSTGARKGVSPAAPKAPAKRKCKGRRTILPEEIQPLPPPLQAPPLSVTRAQVHVIPIPNVTAPSVVVSYSDGAPMGTLRNVSNVIVAHNPHGMLSHQPPLLADASSPQVTKTVGHPVASDAQDHTIGGLQTSDGQDLTIGGLQTSDGQDHTIGGLQTSDGQDHTIGGLQTSDGQDHTIGGLQTSDGQDLTIGGLQTSDGQDHTIGGLQTSDGQDHTIGGLQTSDGQDHTIGGLQTSDGQDHTIGGLQTSDGQDHTIGGLQTSDGQDHTIGGLQTSDGQDHTIGGLQTSDGQDHTIGGLQTSDGQVHNVLTSLQESMCTNKLSPPADVCSDMSFAGSGLQTCPPARKRRRFPGMRRGQKRLHISLPVQNLCVSLPTTNLTDIPIPITDACNLAKDVHTQHVGIDSEESCSLLDEDFSPKFGAPCRQVCTPQEHESGASIGSNVRSLKKKRRIEGTGKPCTGFRTASGRTISVTTLALSRARELIGDDMEVNVTGSGDPLCSMESSPARFSENRPLEGSPTHSSHLPVNDQSAPIVRSTNYQVALKSAALLSKHTSGPSCVIVESTDRHVPLLSESYSDKEAWGLNTHTSVQQQNETFSIPSTREGHLCVKATPNTSSVDALGVTIPDTSSVGALGVAIPDTSSVGALGVTIPDTSSVGALGASVGALGATIPDTSSVGALGATIPDTSSVGALGVTIPDTSLASCIEGEASLTTSSITVPAKQNQRQAATVARRGRSKVFKAPRSASSVSKEEERASLERILGRFRTSGTTPAVGGGRVAAKGSDGLPSRHAGRALVGVHTPCQASVVSTLCTDGTLEPNDCSTLVVATAPPVLAVGFVTASGKNLVASVKALEKAKAFAASVESDLGCGSATLAMDTAAVCVGMEGGDPDTAMECVVTIPADNWSHAAVKEDLVQGQDASLCRSPIRGRNRSAVEGGSNPIIQIHGFRTASGKTLSVSSEALNKAQSLIDDVPEKINQSPGSFQSIQPFGFQTASGKTLSVSSEALKKAQSLLEDVPEKISPNHVSFQCLQPVGFQTASGKTLSVSSEALKKAQSLVEDVPEKISPDHVSFQCLQPVGFQTASGKTLSVSSEALKKAQSLLNAIPENITQFSGSIQSIQPVGFQTASGKTLCVSSETISKVEELFDDLTTLDMHTEAVPIDEDFFDGPTNSHTAPVRFPGACKGSWIDTVPGTEPHSVHPRKDFALETSAVSRSLSAVGTSECPLDGGGRGLGIGLELLGGSVMELVMDDADVHLSTQAVSHFQDFSDEEEQGSESVSPQVGGAGPFHSAPPRFAMPFHTSANILKGGVDQTPQEVVEPHEASRMAAVDRIDLNVQQRSVPSYLMDDQGGGGHGDGVMDGGGHGDGVMGGGSHGDGVMGGGSDHGGSGHSTDDVNLEALIDESYGSAAWPTQHSTHTRQKTDVCNVSMKQLDLDESMLNEMFGDFDEVRECNSQPLPMVTVLPHKDPLKGNTAPPLLKGDTTPPLLKGDTTPPLLKGDTTPPPLKGDTTPPLLKGDTTPPLLKSDMTPPSHNVNDRVASALSNNDVMGSPPHRGGITTSSPLKGDDIVMTSPPIDSTLLEADNPFITTSHHPKSPPYNIGSGPREWPEAAAISMSASMIEDVVGSCEAFLSQRGVGLLQDEQMETAVSMSPGVRMKKSSATRAVVLEGQGRVENLDEMAAKEKGLCCGEVDVRREHGEVGDQESCKGIEEIAEQTLAGKGKLQRTEVCKKWSQWGDTMSLQSVHDNEVMGCKEKENKGDGQSNENDDVAAAEGEIVGLQQAMVEHWFPTLMTAGGKMVEIRQSSLEAARENLGSAPKPSSFPTLMTAGGKMVEVQQSSLEAARENLGSAPKPSSFPTLMTAGGKMVEVQQSSLEAARESLGSTPKPSSFPTLMTAGGKMVEIRQSSLEAARENLGSAPKPSSFPALMTAGGKMVEVQQSSLEAARESLGSAPKPSSFPTLMTAGGKMVEVQQSSLEAARESLGSAPMPSSFPTLMTAGGKMVDVQQSSLEAARESLGSAPKPCSFPTLMTAGGKMVEVQQSSLEAARESLGSPPKPSSFPTLMTAGGKMVEVQQSSLEAARESLGSPPKPSSFPTLMTAGGKMVEVQQSSLEAARESLCSAPKPSSFPTLMTAGGKMVEVQQSSLEAARESLGSAPKPSSFPTLMTAGGKMVEIQNSSLEAAREKVHLAGSHVHDCVGIVSGSAQFIANLSEPSGRTSMYHSIDAALQQIIESATELPDQIHLQPTAVTDLSSCQKAEKEPVGTPVGFQPVRGKGATLSEMVPSNFRELLRTCGSTESG